MEYELAKKLKDAGFPQKTKEWWWDGRVWGTAEPIELKLGESQREDFYNNRIAHPNLTELIEACRDDLQAMYRLKNGWVVGRNAGPLRNVATNASTLEEAIVKLWLALNEYKKVEENTQSK